MQSNYNALIAMSPNTEYAWGGTTYTSAAGFHAATGQGANDIDVSGFWPGRAVPPEHSPLIDNPSRHEV